MLAMYRSHLMPLCMVIDSTRRTIRRHRLISPGDRVVVALSGGPDSVALLFALREIAAADGFVVAGAAHLNHQLRGSDADADEGFCRDLTSGLEVTLHAERVDVAARARAGAVSLEQAAHDVRHEFYARAAARLNAISVAVAHTRNDQAETFLLRLLRGAGPRGLSGMHPRSGIVVRPFIDTRRDGVAAFLQERGIQFREDATNTDLSIPRNRVRHELLPFLESRFVPGIVDVLDREAVIARDDAEYLDSMAAAQADTLLLCKGTTVEIPVSELGALPPAIARRVVRAAQQIASRGRYGGFDAADAVVRMAVSNSAGPLDLPGHRAKRRGSTIVLTESSGRPAPAARVVFNYALEVPGRVRVPEAACAISADMTIVPSGRSARELWALSSRGDEVVLEGDRLRAPLSVRNRVAGDAFRPLGLHGRKKLQDLFVDAKIQSTERDRTPVIVDSAGTILWVAGLALSEAFRVTDRTRAVVILKRVPI